MMIIHPVLNVKFSPGAMVKVQLLTWMRLKVSAIGFVTSSTARGSDGKALAMANPGIKILLRRVIYE